MLDTTADKKIHLTQRAYERSFDDYIEYQLNSQTRPQGFKQNYSQWLAYRFQARIYSLGGAALADCSPNGGWLMEFDDPKLATAFLLKYA